MTTGDVDALQGILDLASWIREGTFLVGVSTQLPGLVVVIEPGAVGVVPPDVVSIPGFV